MDKNTASKIREMMNVSADFETAFLEYLEKEENEDDTGTESEERDQERT